MREASGETRASMVGLDFWPFAHSEVIRKISMRSISAADAVMVPNSLGPGELLMRFGTNEQQQYWPPRPGAATPRARRSQSTP
jgi:alkylation response protein AidB-like acyl-CoA dehydrogenase